MTEGLLILLSYALAKGSNASISQNIDQPTILALYIDQRPPLNFGFIEDGGSGGSITITTSNKRTVNGDIKLTDSIAHGRAKFKIKGHPGETYTVRLPDNIIFTPDNSTYADGFYELRVTNLSSYSVTMGKEGKKGMIDLNGEDTLYIGGTLNVPKHAITGQYSGYIPISVSY